MGMSTFIFEINLQKTPETIYRWCEDFAIIFFVIFVWEELIVFGLVGGNMKKTLRITELDISLSAQSSSPTVYEKNSKIKKKGTRS